MGKTLQAEIISVGNELVAGAHVDLNAPRLARGLLSLGIETKSFKTVPDEQSLLAAALQNAGKRSDIVLVSGGLGPTEDDITRHAAADAVGAELKLDETSWKQLKEYIAQRNRQWTAANERQALFPEGAKVIPNGSGTAPGFKMKIGKATCFFLPGPPGEAEQMLETHILPDLKQIAPGQGVVSQKHLHLFGIPESLVGEKLGDRMARGRDPQVGTTVRKGILTINIYSKDENEGSALEKVQKETVEIRELFAEHCFGEDGEPFSNAVVNLLRHKKITVATAESCTGGLCGKLITDVPGASEIFLGGFITYSNEMKMKELGVAQNTLDQYGAVSEEVAREMAQGVVQQTGAQAGIGITGIAGPDGGSPEKPVGLVYHGLCLNGKTHVLKKIYPPGDRKRIRELAARDALNLLRINLT